MSGVTHGHRVRVGCQHRIEAPISCHDFQYEMFIQAGMKITNSDWSKHFVFRIPCYG